MLQESEKSSSTTIGAQKQLTNPSSGRYSGRMRERSRSGLPQFNKSTSLGTEELPQSIPEYSPYRISARREPVKVGRLILIAVLGLLAIGLIGFMTIKTIGWLVNGLGLGRPGLQRELPMVQLDRPPIEIPEPNRVSTGASGPITKEVAQLAIQSWLNIKAAALGPNHQIEKLQNVLVDPALSRWLPTANSLQREKSYRKYEHDLEIKSVKTSKTNANEAQVDAQVRERVEFYDNDILTNSGNENLLVRYNLVRQNEKWRISNWKVQRKF